MAITVKINTVDKSSLIIWESLRVVQNINEKVDTATFQLRSKIGSKTFVPVIKDTIEISDGSTVILAGEILKVDDEVESGAEGVIYTVQCVDHSHRLTELLAGKTYTSQTIKAIITDLFSSYESNYNANNVDSEFVVDKIVFNQIPLLTCIKRLAKIINAEFYIDENKSCHLFDRNTKTSPFNITDDGGNYEYKTYRRAIDGSQLANFVKVRGAEYNGTSITDVITVKGNDSKRFKLPYKIANLAIRLDTGGGYVAKTVGQSFVDDFTSKDVLQSFQDRSIEFENALADGDKIEYSGNPKVRTFAAAQDPISIAQFGRIEKIIRENDIVDNAVARRRANAEIYAYSSQMVDGKFKTRTSGLRVGMRINVQSDIRGTDDDLLIKKLVFKTIDPSTFEYDVELVSSRRQDFVELLASILEPEALDIDETETSEEIFLDTQTINILEEIENVTPFADEQTVSIAENLLLDPLGAGVEPDWVYGYYAPTSQADTKRMGKYDRDAKYS